MSMLMQFNASFGIATGRQLVDNCNMWSYTCKIYRVVPWCSPNSAIISLMVMPLSESSTTDTLATLLASFAVDNLLLLVSYWTLLCLVWRWLFQCFTVSLRRVGILINSKISSWICFSPWEFNYATNLCCVHDTTSYTTDPDFHSHKFLCFVPAHTCHVCTANVSQYCLHNKLHHFLS